MNAPHSPTRNDRGEVVSAVDWLGNRFHVGSLVLHCVSAGSSQQMAIGKVTKIRAVQRTSQDYSEPIDPEDPLRNYKSITRFYDDVSVEIADLRTSLGGDREREPRWVKGGNVTAFRPVGTHL